MKKPNYFIFGMVWLVAAVVSILNFVQYFDDRGNLIRGGLFLMMSIFYFWLNRKSKGGGDENGKG